MHIEFKEISFKNILSYGNSLTTLTFDNSLNLIKAANGSGKSTILDAISFALYGKPYRNIKLDSLVNSVNKKNLLVSLTFDDGKDEYTITRGLKPAVLNIKKNGKDVELMSTKKLIQEDIDSIIGINNFRFKNIVAIASTYNKPFLALSNTDRSILFENLFNLDVMRRIAKTVKADNVVSKQNLLLANSDKNHLVSDISKSQQTIASMKANLDVLIANSDAKKKAALADLAENIKNNETKLADFKRQLEEISGLEFNDSDLEELTKRNADENASIALLRQEFDSTTAKVCPTCGASLNNDEIHLHKGEELAEAIEAHKSTLAAFEASTNERTKRNENNALKERLKLIIDVGSAKNEENRKEYEKISSSTVDFAGIERSIKDEEKTLDSYNSQLAIKEVEVWKYSKDTEVNANLLRLTGEDGIRKFIFDKMIQVLNNIVNDYLGKFGMNCRLNLGTDLDYEIIANSQPKEYNCFSNGEKTRIDMAILLGLLMLSSDMANWSTNLLFIDELFDRGIDDDGIESLLVALRDLVRTKHQACYLVSHKLNREDLFSHVIRIEKTAGFSVLIDNISE